jgi:hypothetical protein
MTPFAAILLRLREDPTALPARMVAAIAANHSLVTRDDGRSAANIRQAAGAADEAAALFHFLFARRRLTTQ